MSLKLFSFFQLQGFRKPLHNLLSSNMREDRRMADPMVSVTITFHIMNNLQFCQDNRTVKLISHPSRVMLKVILNRFKPQAQEMILKNRLGSEPEGAQQIIFNLRILCEKYCHLYQVLDFKKHLKHNGMHLYGLLCGSTVSLQI